MKNKCIEKTPSMSIFIHMNSCKHEDVAIRLKKKPTSKFMKIRSLF